MDAGNVVVDLEWVVDIFSILLTYVGMDSLTVCFV